MDIATQRKWDNAVRGYDLMNGFGPERRWEPWKRQLFSHMAGNVLFLAIGTGQDIQFFPPGRRITGMLSGMVVGMRAASGPMSTGAAVALGAALSTRRSPPARSVQCRTRSMVYALWVAY